MNDNGHPRAAIVQAAFLLSCVEIELLIRSLDDILAVLPRACPISMQLLPACCSPKPQPVTDECEWFTHVAWFAHLTPYAAQACLSDLDRSNGPSYTTYPLNPLVHAPNHTCRGVQHAAAHHEAPTCTRSGQWQHAEGCCEQHGGQWWWCELWGKALYYYTTIYIYIYIYTYTYLHPKHLIKALN